jgi:dolichol-phosphate mannosyltransferase
MLSIIIPCFGSEPFLPTLMAEISRCVSEPFEILIQSEIGLGYAVMCGVKRSKGEYILVCDSDGSHNPKYISEMLWLARNGHDIVIGSRYIKGGGTQDSFSREMISRVYCLFAQVLFRLEIKDNMSGFILVKRQVFLLYPIDVYGFKFGLDLLVRSKKYCSVVEYPFVFEARKLGVSKASPMEALRTLKLILKLCAHVKGKS